MYAPFLFINLGSIFFFFFSSRRRHTRFSRDWSSDVCSSDLDFKRNPQQFIELAAETINRCKRMALVDGIKYQKLGDQHVYAQELFEKEEQIGRASCRERV